MNRSEFMDELKRRLQKLPYDEAKEAIEYYNQYFDDAGAESEQDVINELGSPANIASGVIAEFAIKDAKSVSKSAKKGLNNIWLVILAIFASPIALPLALAAVIIAFALIIVLFAIIFSFGVTGIALLISGIGAIIISLPIVVQSVPTTIFFIGGGLFCLGLGTAIIIGTVLLSKKCFSFIAERLGKFILRRSAKN